MWGGVAIESAAITAQFNCLQAEMQAESYGNGATTAQLKERKDEDLCI
jgi:hypothetical protein